MLLRRKIRKQALVHFYITPANVKSHINGSITFAVRIGNHFGGTCHDLLTLKSRLGDFFETYGHQGMLAVREGTFRRSILYVTYSSEALVDEAVARYGLTGMRNALIVARGVLEQGSATILDQQAVTVLVDAAMSDDDFDFDAVPVTVGLDPEGSEL